MCPVTGPRLVAAVLAAAVAAVVVVIGAGPSARAGAEATAVLDRTYTCAVFYRGGTYLVEARAHSGTKLHGDWARLPYASVRSGVFSGGAGNLLVWITAGRPAKGTKIDQEYDTFDVGTFGTIGVRRESCRQTSARVTLTSAGLRGGRAAPLGTEFECYTPKQVVFHVRAVLTGSARLRAGQDYQTSHVPARKASFAVRTPTGKPLLYASVDESGAAGIFAAGGCTAG
jgi:hypothetical protein